MCRRRMSRPLHSSFLIPHSAFSPRSGYTLVELFLTLAVLMVILGMMMNLSKRVRREAADKLTRQMLSELKGMMDEYTRQNDGHLPPVMPLMDLSQANSLAVSESDLLIRARQNNAQFFRYLRLGELAKRDTAGNDPLVSALHHAGPQSSVLEDSGIEDPWGSPIVFMPKQDPAIGMAPRDDFFFFSAGPDRLFLTREDNLYSYEESALTRNAE